VSAHPGQCLPDGRTSEPTSDCGEPVGGHKCGEFDEFVSRVLSELRKLQDRQGGLVAGSQDPVFDVASGGWRCLVFYCCDNAPQHELSHRELEIARMVADGQTNRAIAKVLGISSWTVSAHLRHIFAKLNVGSRAEMVAVLSRRVLPVGPTEGSRCRSREGAGHGGVGSPIGGSV